MKQLKSILLIAALALISCGGGDDDPYIPEPKPETPSYGIDDPHETQSDQPAYSRQQ
jgi:hypothetical protein